MARSYNLKTYPYIFLITDAVGNTRYIETDLDFPSLLYFRYSIVPILHFLRYARSLPVSAARTRSTWGATFILTEVENAFLQSFLSVKEALTFWEPIEGGVYGCEVPMLKHGSPYLLN